MNRSLTKRLLRGAAVAACALALSLPAVPARAADEDWQQWTLFLFQHEISDRWRAYFEIQPRIGSDFTTFERLIVRPAIGYRLTPKLSIWQGYGWTPLFSPQFADEHRPFQQLLYEDRIGRTSLVNRTRLEQRVIEGAGDVSVRARNFLRLAHPISRDGRWTIVGYDEIFWNLNSTPNGPVSGYDQNRLFVGVSRHINPQFRVETGYLLNTIDAPRRASNRIIHAWVTTFAFTL
jgi:hypothetical protein